MPATVAIARTRCGIAAAHASAYGPPPDHPAKPLLLTRIAATPDKTPALALFRRPMKSSAS